MSCVLPCLATEYTTSRRGHPSHKFEHGRRSLGLASALIGFLSRPRGSREALRRNGRRTKNTWKRNTLTWNCVRNRSFSFNQQYRLWCKSMNKIYAIWLQPIKMNVVQKFFFCIRKKRSVFPSQPIYYCPQDHWCPHIIKNDNKNYRQGSPFLQPIS